MFASEQNGTIELHDTTRDASALGTPGPTTRIGLPICSHETIAKGQGHRRFDHLHSLEAGSIDEKSREPRPVSNCQSALWQRHHTIAFDEAPPDQSTTQPSSGCHQPEAEGTIVGVVARVHI